MNASNGMQAGLPVAERKMLLGLIGAGIQLSLTPAMQEEEGRHHGIRVHYQLIDLDRTGADASALPALASAARVMGFAGLNVTYPCKQAIIPLLDELSDDARLIGAVNTVVVKDGRLIGHNTDCSGWKNGFVNSLPDADMSRVVLLGAGGAGAAIAHAAMQLATRELLIVDSDPARAQALAASICEVYGAARAKAASELAAAVRGATGLIHATPTGMAKLPGMPLDAALLRPDLWVAEIVYFPIETELLRRARALGCRTCDGGGMAVWQAVGAFELFTGEKADPARMRAHFLSLLAQRAG